jgi:hypothetical protein
MKKFVIKGLGDPFDGLVIHTRDDLNDIVLVERIQQNHALFDSFSLPVAPGLYISRDCLVDFVDVEDEQEIGNPQGEYLYDVKLESGSLNLTWVVYERAVSVGVRNGDNALYSHMFMGEDKRASVLHFLKELQSDSDYDWDDLVFDLGDHE